MVEEEVEVGYIAGREYGAKDVQVPFGAHPSVLHRPTASRTSLPHYLIQISSSCHRKPKSPLSIPRVPRLASQLPLVLHRLCLSRCIFWADSWLCLHPLHAVSLQSRVIVVDRLGTGLDRPVEDVVILEAFADEQVTEQLPEVGVVGLVVETEGSGVVEVDSELVRESSAENFGGGGHLCICLAQFLDDTADEHTLLHDTVVLLLLGCSLETLPWKLAPEEVLRKVSLATTDRSSKLTIRT